MLRRLVACRGHQARVLSVGDGRLVNPVFGQLDSLLLVSILERAWRNADHLFTISPADHAIGRTHASSLLRCGAVPRQLLYPPQAASLSRLLRLPPREEQLDVRYRLRSISGSSVERRLQRRGDGGAEVRRSARGGVSVAALVIRCTLSGGQWPASVTCGVAPSAYTSLRSSGPPIRTAPAG